LLATVALACGNDQEVDPGAPSGQAQSVDVTFGSKTVTVSLEPLQTVDYKGIGAVPLHDVWNAAHGSVSPSSLAFVFESDEGFKPSDKDCADVPGTVLDKGYLEKTTRNLIWDESLGFRGCYSVRGTKSITGVDPGDAGLPDATVVE
jgi:hypothetical protein